MQLTATQININQFLQSLSEPAQANIQGGTEFSVVAVAETSEHSLVRTIPTIARKTQPST